ncbi:putative porin [Mucilaginibacter gynuensis]|uniref:Porin n=1 Tax=Mucilaginibacter gynuensis TaxID=1302236 RepID=A0ABP8GWU9_9SPHI
MQARLKYILLLLISLSVQAAFAQFPTRTNNPSQYPGQRQPNYMRDTSTRKAAKQLTDSELIDTLRKREEEKHDSVVFNSKFIKITNVNALNDSTQVFALDTGLVNFENYSPLHQPRSPRIGLGYIGVAQRPLLFEPAKTIGFDVGLHALDPYLLSEENINYYNARVQFTNLFYVGGGSKVQMLKVIHTQNIKPNWNFGFNLNFNGSKGYYATSSVLKQNVSDMSGALFTWYESKSKRYNLLANVLMNNLKAPETGSILNDSVFTSTAGRVFLKDNATVRLPNTYEQWKQTTLYIKQFYYIGHIDSLNRKDGKDSLSTTSSENSKILPTQRVAHTFMFTKRKYHFIQNEQDVYNVFPDYYFSSRTSSDSLTVNHLQNDFSYSFYLRGKSLSFVKNEMKLDVGLVHDFYNYTQLVTDTAVNEFGAQYIRKNKVQNTIFQNVTLKGKASYKFSDLVVLEADIKQIVQGRDFGNFLYDAKLILSGGKRVGKVIFGAYTQNSSAPLVATNWISNHYIFHNDFNNIKTTNLSFNYVNEALQLDLKAEYFLINDYLYYTATPGANDAHPEQLGSAINLLKVSLGKNLQWRRWHFDNYAVYQKTDYQSVLRTPEVYTYSSLYYATPLFKVLNSNIGLTVRYNTPYIAPSYAIGLGQFYNGPDVTFTSYPVATAFFKATLYSANLFVQYDYANQGLFSKGFYTVNRYPMQDALLKFGVSWTFYQ